MSAKNPADLFSCLQFLRYPKNTALFSYYLLSSGIASYVGHWNSDVIPTLDTAVLCSSRAGYTYIVFQRNITNLGRASL